MKFRLESLKSWYESSNWIAENGHFWVKKVGLPPYRKWAFLAIFTILIGEFVPGMDVIFWGKNLQLKCSKMLIFEVKSWKSGSSEIDRESWSRTRESERDRGSGPARGVTHDRVQIDASEYADRCKRGWDFPRPDLRAGVNFPFVSSFWRSFFFFFSLTTICILASKNEEYINGQVLMLGKHATCSDKHMNES